MQPRSEGLSSRDPRNEVYWSTVPGINEEGKVVYDCLNYASARRSRSLCRQTIGTGGTVAAYVAATGERLFVKDILGVMYP